MFSIVCLLTIVSISNYTDVKADGTIIDDPEDPGNSPGPGLPPVSIDIDLNPIFQFTVNDGVNFLSL